MARRKKEPRSAHRERIAAAASKVFSEKGTVSVTMDEIAKAAGYSKATLYVYFQNKEEIVGFLVLESMKNLSRAITDALEQEGDSRARYDRICQKLVQYQEEYPFYFQMVLKQINIDFSREDCLPEEEETYQVGEEINAALLTFLRTGIEKGELREDLPLIPTIFHVWGMLSGLIQLAVNKEDYIKASMGLTKEQFLAGGFHTLYSSIQKTKG